MGRKTDITPHIGVKFGKLTVLREAKERDKSGCIQWECECECGALCTVRAVNILNSRVFSCGCLRSSSALLKKEMGWLRETRIGRNIGKHYVKAVKQKKYKREYERLKQKFSHLWDEWLPDKNGNQSLEQLSPFSMTEYHWQCASCNHTWKESIARRCKAVNTCQNQSCENYIFAEKNDPGELSHLDRRKKTDSYKKAKESFIQVLDQIGATLKDEYKGVSAKHEIACRENHKLMVTPHQVNASVKKGLEICGYCRQEKKKSA